MLYSVVTRVLSEITVVGTKVVWMRVVVVTVGTRVVYVVVAVVVVG